MGYCPRWKNRFKKCFYINNGIDIEVFNQNIKKYIVDDEELNSDKFNVVYAGSIRPVNDVGKILLSAKLLKNQSDIQFLIYGDGNQKTILEQQIIDEGLTNVKLKGYINKRYIPYILSKANVNLLNYSQTQYNWARGNSSNKLFEYMASGKPIISTVKMGYSIIERYQCGIELEKGTPQELADTILKFKNMNKNEYNMIGQNAKKGAENFDFKELTKKLIDIIEGVG